MKSLSLFLVLAAASFGADKSWSNVVDLKTGTELRIYKRGSSLPVMAKMDEANDRRIVVILKHTQTAIPKDDIDRIDSRPESKSPRVERETKVTNNVPGSRPDLPAPRAGGQGVNTSTGFRFGSRPDFETVYRRPARELASPR